MSFLTCPATSASDMYVNTAPSPGSLLAESFGSMGRCSRTSRPLRLASSAISLEYGRNGSTATAIGASISRISRSRSISSPRSSMTIATLALCKWGFEGIGSCGFSIFAKAGNPGVPVDVSFFPLWPVNNMMPVMTIAEKSSAIPKTNRAFDNKGPILVRTLFIIFMVC